MINMHCQLTENISKYTLVTNSENRRISSLHVYLVFSWNYVRWHTTHFVRLCHIYCCIYINTHNIKSQQKFLSELVVIAKVRDKYSMGWQVVTYLGSSGVFYNNKVRKLNCYCIYVLGNQAHRLIKMEVSISLKTDQFWTINFV